MENQEVQEYDLEKYRAFLEREERRMLEDAEYSAAVICLNYPRYSLEEATKLDEGDSKLLLKAVIRAKAEDYLMQLSIQAASKDRNSYKKLFNELRRKIERSR